MKEKDQLRERLWRIKARMAEANGDAAATHKFWEDLWEVCFLLAERLEGIETWQEEMGAYLEALDGDLAELEGLLNPQEEDEEDDSPGLCPHCHRPLPVS